MVYIAHITVENYGVVQVPMPPKRYRKDKDVLLQMLGMAVQETMTLMTEKTVERFNYAINEVITNVDTIPHKHKLKLAEDENPSFTHILWRCVHCDQTAIADRVIFYFALLDYHGEM